MARRARLVVLVDNEPGEGLLSEWGWSLYLELEGRRVLFDADTSPRVLGFNAQRLGVDLSRLDYAVLSHHHSDHYGGFSAVAEARPGLRVYAPPGRTGYLERMGLEPVVVTSTRRVEGGVWVIGPLRSASWSLYEQGLAVDVEGHGVILVVGCSHPGVDRLAEEAVKATGKPLHLVIGGFHSPSREVLDRLAGLAERIAPAHCSGAWAKSYVRTQYPEKYVPVRTGTVIELPAH